MNKQTNWPPGNVSSPSSVRIAVGPVTLEGQWHTPTGATGIVLFAQGSGSSRHSLRNQAVARVLQKSRTGTLLFDLLTRAEKTVDARTGHLRFDIGLLAQRLAEVTRWVTLQTEGRPDLASGSLAQVQAPTLLIVGQQDEVVLDINEKALERLNCEKDLAVVPRATHLFEEPGALEIVASLAAMWFQWHLKPR